MGASDSFGRETAGTILYVLLEDDERLVLRAPHGLAGDLAPVLIVRPKAELTQTSMAPRIANEYALRSHLDSSWAAHPRALLQDDLTSLVLDDPGGEVLLNQIDGPIPVGRFLRVAMAIAEAVGRMHQAGLLHKDIKPSNLLVDTAGSQAWVTGFGIATRLPSERQKPGPPEVIAGTFAYMAPEQTGRMNRPVDARSDLYALGVTFYQMLTGVLPFNAADPMEWIHSHIARLPVPPAERVASIPAPLSALVMKLLAKTAEDRYRTAEGLRADLDRCLRDWETDRTVHPFQHGLHDTPSRLVFGEKLYGRDDETRRLAGVFERVVTTSRPALVLVSGYSGIGKSAFVNELHRPVVGRRGFFATGKFDRYKRGIPYATLAQAFRELVAQLLVKPVSELAGWRDAILAALGPNGRLVCQIVPELEQIIGEPRPVPALSGPEAENRLRLVLRQFISVFARPEHPLVLFFDDLQWLDFATLDVFEALIAQAEAESLLLAGAYRDNEVGADHPLTGRLASIKEAGALVEEFVLTGIGEQHVALMLADVLDHKPQRVADLAHVVFEKAGGNPFFSTQFVSALLDEGLLAYDAEMVAWHWDVEGIRARHASDSVVHLMIERLQRLPENSRRILQQLACLGNSIKARTLGHVIGRTDQETSSLLHEALALGLIFRTGDSFAFAHDRVHEAAYATISEDEKGRLHGSIGARLLETLSSADLDIELFEVVSQFNRAGPDNLAGTDPVAVAALNLRAARRAKASAAYRSACAYLAQGCTQLGQSGWIDDPQLAFALAMEQAECTFLAGDLDETERLIAALLDRPTGKIDRAAAYRLKVELCVVRSDNSGAVANAVTALSLLDVDLPTTPTWEDVQQEYDAIWENLRGQPVESFANLPPMTSAAPLAAMRLLAEMQPPAYFSNFNMTILVICRMVNLSLVHGAASTSSQGLVLLGYVIGPAFGRYEDGYRIARLAGDLAATRNGAVDRARVDHLTGLAAAWTEPLPVALDWLRSAYRGGVEAGDLYYACFEAAVIVLHLFVSGQKLDDVDDECRRALKFARDTGFQAGIGLILATSRAVAALRGQTHGLSDYDDDEFDSAVFEADLARSQNSVVNWWYWTRKVMLHHLAGEYRAALEAASRVNNQPSIRNMQIEQMDCFYYAALAAAALFAVASMTERAALREQISSHHDRLREWAEATGSPTFADKHVLIAAELARLDGRDLEAQHLYEDSIRLARDNGFPQNEAVANETAGRFYLHRGFARIGLMHLRDAKACYQRWGAHAKTHSMEAEFLELQDPQRALFSGATTIAPVEQLDLATVIKVAQTVSGELVLEKLIDRLMRTTIEHAGAGRAALVLTHEAEPHVEAEAEMTEQGIVVRLRDSGRLGGVLPEAIVQHVLRTRETVVLDHAVADSPFAGDPYVLERGIRSLLAVPLVNHGNLIGLLYLENTLAANVFTSNQISILKLIASHAAFALENTRLYQDVKDREARIRRLVDANIIGVFMWKLDGSIFEANDSFLQMLGFDREDLAAGRVRWTDLSPPEGWENDAKVVEEVVSTGVARPWEKEFFHKDGRRVPVLMGAASFSEPGFDDDGGVTFILDLSARRQAEEEARASERRYRELQSELAHANRVATVGQLSVAISHELRQPLVGVVTSGSAGLNWLAAQPPNIAAAREAMSRVVSEGHRAAQVLDRTRAFVTKLPPRMDPIDINSIITDTVALVNEQADLLRVRLSLDLDFDLSHVSADRVQLQQVLLNLALNALEAMADADGAVRELTIVSGYEGSEVFVAVRDTGPGIAADRREQIFDAFYSTRPDGMGMGLAICRTIVELHGGTLTVSPNEPRGAVFRFRLPVVQDN